MKEKPNAAYQPLNERAKVFAERRNAYQAIAKRYAGAETEADAYIALLERCGELTQYHATNQEAEEERMVSELLAIARRSLERFAKSPRAAYFTNYVNNREQPNLQTSDFPTVAYPGTSHTFALHHCNVAEADMRLIRLNLSASEYDKLRYEDTRNLRKFHGATVSDRHSVFSEAPAYAWRTDSLTLTMPEQPGLYSLELLNKGKVIDRQVVHVSRLRLMQLQTGENKLRLVAVDGMSGVPLEGVSLLEFSVDNENRRTQLRKLPFRRKELKYLPPTAAIPSFPTSTPPPTTPCLHSASSVATCSMSSIWNTCEPTSFSTVPSTVRDRASRWAA